MTEIVQGMAALSVSNREKAIHLIQMLNKTLITDLAGDWFDFSSWEVQYDVDDEKVQLTDSDGNVLRDHNGALDLWLCSPKGTSGYFDDLMHNFLKMNEIDKKFMVEVANDTMKDKYPVLSDGTIMFFNGGIGR